LSISSRPLPESFSAARIDCSAMLRLSARRAGLDEAKRVPIFIRA
jgi:hypothetical protein